MIKHIHKAILQFIHVDFPKEIINDNSEDEIRKIRMVNYIGLIGIVNILVYTLVYALIDFKLFIAAILFFVISILFVFVIIAFNNKGYFTLAKLLLASIFPFVIVINSIFLFEKETGSHVFFLLYALIPIFLWSTKSLGYIIFFISLNIFLYVWIEFFPMSINKIVDMPDIYLVFFKSTNLLVSFLGEAFVLGVFIILSDKKEKQLIKQAVELKNSQLHRDVVYSIIAHDLRSPFNGLMGFSELLLNEYNNYDDESRQESIKAIHDSSKKLNILLENLLDWSKMQLGKLETNSKTFFLKQIIEEVIQLLDDLIKHKKLVLTVDIKSNTKVYADLYMVSTIFRNLLSNAIKFTPEGGNISIKVNQQNGIVESCIIDSGVGIPNSNINQLFSLESTFTTLGTNSEKGSGLGLKICKDFVEANGGILKVESELNQGSKFCFSLKAAI